MLHIAKYLHGKFWLLVAWLVIAIAILLTLMRLFLPLVDLTPYKEEIQRLVEEETGMSLRIGSMHVELYRAHLALKLTDISLMDPQSGLSRLQLRQAFADIRLLASLIKRRITFGGAMISGTTLRIIRRWDGSFMVNGFQESASARNGTLAGIFLHGTRLKVEDSVIYWLDEKSGMPTLRFSQVNAILLNSDDRHQMVATLRLGEDEDQAIQLVADLQEGRNSPVDLSGRVYLKTQDVELGGRLGNKLIRDFQVARGLVDLELWGEVRNSRFVRFHGTSDLRRLKLIPATQKSLELERVSSLFAWRQMKDGWRLDLDRLILVQDRQLWPPGSISAVWKKGEVDGYHLQLGADYLGLREMTEIFELFLPQESKLRESLTGLSPTGHLTQLRLALDRQGEEKTAWRISGVISSYHSQPWKSVPGLAGLGLRFEGDQHGGTLALSSKGFVMEMPGLFRESLSADRLDGYFKWRYSAEQGLNLQTSNLHVSTDHVQTLSRLELQIPLTGESPLIDMQTDFWQGDAAEKSRYLPVGIMPAPLVNWLDRSVVTGTVNAGSFLLYGPLKAFPYKQPEGRFEVLFGVENLVLDYMPAWPRLEEVVAEAHFLNNSLNIDLFEGKMLHSRLRHATAKIERLSDGTPVEIEGSLDGPVEDQFRILAETPLKRQFDKFTQAVSGSGQARTELNLRIPLKRRDRLAIQGKVDFNKAALVIEQQDLQIEDLSGRLEFDDRKVWAKHLAGRLLGQAAGFQVSPQQRDGNRSTKITTELLVSSNWLRQRFPELDFLNGVMPAEVSLEVAHAQNKVPLRLSIHSDLQRTSINLPKPLGKQPQESRDTEVRIDFRSDGKTDIKLHYAELLQAWLRDSGAGITRGDLRIGRGAVTLPEKKGFRLHGAAQNLDLDHWIAWFNQQSDPMKGSAGLPVEIDLRIAKLLLAGLSCANVRVEAGHVDAGWRVKVNSKDISGNLSLPDALEQIPIAIHLDHLKLKSADIKLGSTEKKAREPQADKDPSTMPDLDLQIDSLSLDDKPLGRAVLKWRRGPAGIDLTQLSIDGELLSVQGEGFWRLKAGQHQTRLVLKGKVVSLERLQEQFDIQLGVAKAPMAMDAKLEWPLPPYRMALDSLAGSVHLVVESGEITQVDPGVGRLVGLFSLHALGKRLLLDFSDLFSKGLEFDHIEGNFELTGGNAYTADLEMVGPAVKVDISGRTGLKARDYDQLVTVTPRVSSTLPVVGALAVNPTVGVVLAVAQQLLGKQMDSITSTEYQLTGSWDKPVIKKMVSEAAEADAAEDLLDLQ